MLHYKSAFSSFPVTDLKAARNFFEDVLGFVVRDGRRGLYLQLGNDQMALIYPKADHHPAEFTVLNFHVEDLEETMADMIKKGVVFLRYSGKLETNEKGIKENPDGPNVAWFKDPFGNIMSVMEKF